MMQDAVIIDDNRRMVSDGSRNGHEKNIAKLKITRRAIEELETFGSEVIHEEVLAGAPPSMRVGVVP